MWNWLLTHSPLLYFTQSLWRDEAFSILVAQKPISFILQNLTFEPPVYYLLLHWWMRVFGTDEIAVRSLSFLAFAAATVVVIIWSEKLFGKHWLSWATPTLFFTNPMLIYYAFEIRTYGWYTLFAVLSLYAYQQTKWRLWVAATLLGFYTHTYFLFLFAALCFHWGALHWRRLSKPWVLLREPMVASSALIISAMIPWVIRVVKEAVTLKQTWYFPVGVDLVKSVLGNMYLGYEGTPWHLWGFTANVSLILLIVFFFAVVKKATRARNSLFLFAVFVPLALVVGVSFIKPLFVNRYLISVTVAEVFLVAFAIEAVKNTVLQKLFASCLLLFAIAFNIWYPRQHAKVNIRASMQEINAIKAKDDLILAQSPLILFETIYYAEDESHVFLYNPYRVPFPWYVGGILVSADRMVTDVPPYPARAFLVAEDGTYRVAYRTTVSPLARKP